MMLFVLSALGADIIITKDGKKIESIVAEITSNEVKYRKASNPNGPLYTILISEIVLIDYENGEQDVFSSESASKSKINPDNTLPQSVFSGVTGNHRDAELMRMYNNKDAYKDVKKLKLIGWIGGSVLAAGAVATFIAVSFDDAATAAVIGGPILAGGIIWTTSFLIAANNKKKKIDEERMLYSMPVLQKEIFNHNGKSLDMSVNYIANRANTRAIGLGLTYNF